MRFVGGSSGTIPNLLVQITGLSKEDGAANLTPSIEDARAGQIPNAKVVFDSPERVAVLPYGGIWRFRVTVGDYRENTTDNRVALAKLNGTTVLQAYVLTNLPASAANFSVAAPAMPWFVNWNGSPEDRAFAITVTTQDQPATRFRLSQAAAQDSLGLSSIGPGQVYLTDNAEGTETPLINLKARSTRTLFLHLKPEGLRSVHGKFTGSASFVVDEKPDPQNISLDMRVTSYCAKVAGLFVLAVALLLTWWITVRIKPGIVRLQALKAVIAVRDSVERLRTELSKVPAIPGQEYEETRTQLDALTTKLSTGSLDKAGALPSRSLLSFGSPEDSSSKLKEELTSATTKVAALTVLLRSGYVPAATAWRTSDESRQRLIQTAITKLDEAAANVTTPDEAAAKVATEVQTYTLREADFAGRLDPVTLEQANYLIQWYSDAGWFAWGFIALVVGAAVLILPKADFGTPLDYVYCLLWGAGIPTAGTALQSVTPTSVTTSLGIGLPKPPTGSA
jgi:hypothetical protein